MLSYSAKRLGLLRDRNQHDKKVLSNTDEGIKANKRYLAMCEEIGKSEKQLRNESFKRSRKIDDGVLYPNREVIELVLLAKYATTNPKPSNLDQ